MIPHSKVFVGGLPSGSKPHELRRLFENYGVVTECDIMNRCGFVHMETPQMADMAIRALNNTSFRGAMITVEPGRPKNRNAGDGGGMSRGPGGGGGGPGQRFGRGGPGGSRGNFSGGSGAGELDDRGIGPIRRERGVGQRRGGEPYSRSSRGSGDGFQDSFQGGSRNRNFDASSGGSSHYNYGPPNTYSSGNNGGMGGYASGGGSGSYGMGSQDKRGFALPDHSYQSRSSATMASPEHAAGINPTGRAGIRPGSNPNPFSRSMQALGEEAAGGGFGRSNSFGRGRGGMGMNQSERPFSAPNRDSHRFGQGGGSQADGRFSMNQNYEESFPPLNVAAGQRGGFRGRGGGGRGFGRGGGPPNRNGFPQQGMMMDRFQ